MIDRLFQDKNLCGQSKKWANWMSKLSITTCMFCAKNHGKIVDISVLSNKYEVNAHLRCKCVYVPMRVKVRGTATNLGLKGADINYDGGFRNDERIIFSNDGLIFVTYDHYETFYEVIK